MTVKWEHGLRGLCVTTVVAKDSNEKPEELHNNLCVVEVNVGPLRRSKSALITGITETVRLVSGHHGLTVIRNVQLGAKGGQE